MSDRYTSHVVLGEQYEDVATGRIGTVTAIQFRLGEGANAKLEWRTGEKQADMWVAASRLDEYESQQTGESL